MHERGPWEPFLGASLTTVWQHPSRPRRESQCCLDGGRGAFAIAIDQMRVHIQSEAEGRVAQLRADLLRMHVGPQALRRVEVADIEKADPWQVSRLRQQPRRVPRRVTKLM